MEGHDDLKMPSFHPTESLASVWVQRQVNVEVPPPRSPQAGKAALLGHPSAGRLVITPSCPFGDCAGMFCFS